MILPHLFSASSCFVIILRPCVFFISFFVLLTILINNPSDHTFRNAALCSGILSPRISTPPTNSKMQFRSNEYGIMYLQSFFFALMAGSIVKWDQSRIKGKCCVETEQCVLPDNKRIKQTALIGYNFMY